jgi:hypothetical protein
MGNDPRMWKRQRHHQLALILFLSFSFDFFDYIIKVLEDRELMGPPKVEKNSLFLIHFFL